MKPLFCLSLILLLGSACKTGTRETAPAGVIDVSGVWNSDTVMMLSSIAQDIEYIPLETNAECILGDYYNVRAVVLKNYIIVSEYKKPLRLFSRSGKYQGLIGGIGQGPMEYSERFTYTYDEEANLVVILDLQQKKLLKFNFNREYTGSVRLAAYPSKVIIDGPDKFGILYQPWTEMEKDTARFEWIDGTGKVLNSVKLYQDRPKDGGGTSSLSARLYKINGQVHFIEKPYDTIYQLTDNKEFKPVWYFAAWPNKLPRESSLDIGRYNKDFPNFSSVESVFETPDYMFMRGVDKRMTRTIFYDINKRKAWSLKLQEGFEGFFLGRQGFHNDLDGGVPFWPNSTKEILPGFHNSS
ncbi:MAG: 6-bladed beta-propeller [Bacteroidia bacterium]|nr:6-bladed beta-propeller [Bacteroidia bacterium]